MDTTTTPFQKSIKPQITIVCTLPIKQWEKTNTMFQLISAKISVTIDTKQNYWYVCGSEGLLLALKKSVDVHNIIFRREEGYWGVRALLLIRIELFYDKREIILFTNIEFLLVLRQADLFIYNKTLNRLLQISKQNKTKKNLNKFEKVQTLHYLLLF